jgi:hypothetical protein
MNEKRLDKILSKYQVLSSAYIYQMLNQANNEGPGLTKANGGEVSPFSKAFQDGNKEFHNN